MNDQMVSNKLDTLKEAQEKCEEAARIVQRHYPGSYLKWISSTILRVFSRSHEGVATFHVEKLQ